MNFDDLSIERKRAVLREIEQMTNVFRADLSLGYPFQDIAEFTRLRDALDNFLHYGFWERHLEDESE